MSDTLLLTIPEAAAELRLSRWTVYDLISTGALRSVNVSTRGGSKARIRRDDLQAFIDGRTSASPRRAS